MSEELPKLIAALETIDTAVELCAIAEERPTAEAHKVRIGLMHERVRSRSSARQRQRRPRPVSSQQSLTRRRAVRWPMASRQGGRPSVLSRARGIAGEGEMK